MSGRKNSLVQYQVIKGGDGSGDLTGPSTNIQNLDNIGYQINMTGTMTGVFSVQVSADNTNWVSLTLNPPLSVASGSPTNIYADINQISAPWIRLIYTHTSGSGTVNAFITGKML
jgi:flagellar basal body P-ring protein FlgI